MIDQIKSTEDFEQLLNALKKADAVVQAEDGDIAAVRMTDQKVLFVIERGDGIADDPDPWRGYCHLPVQLFHELAKAAKGDILAKLDQIQYYIANAAEIDSTFDEVLFGNYIEFISREEAAKKLGFEWWK